MSCNIQVITPFPQHFPPQMDPLRHFLLRIDYALLSIEPAVVPRADGLGEAVKALLDAVGCCWKLGESSVENCGDYYRRITVGFLYAFFFRQLNIQKCSEPFLTFSLANVHRTFYFLSGQMAPHPPL